MEITKEGRHEYSKKRRKLVRKGLNTYDDCMLINLDKEWAQLRVRIDSIKYISCGKLVLMNEFEDTYYREIGHFDELDRIMYELSILRASITEKTLIDELDNVLDELKLGTTKNNLLKLKRVITRLQASVNLPIHFYEALDDEYRDVYQSVINDNFKIR